MATSLSKIMPCVMIALFAVIPVMSQTTPTLTEAEAQEIGIEAYIYGYPLVTMDATRRVMTNAIVPGNNKAPMGQFFNARTYPNASFKDVTAPNADTLYSTAWIDLTAEPYVLHVPEIKNRYYLMPMLSGWTDVFGEPGTRTTGTKAGDYAITGPTWKGKLPEHVKELKSPTDMVWIIGRTYSTGTPEDYSAVHLIQDHYSLRPLSTFGKGYLPPRGTVDPSIDMKTPVRDQVNRLDAGTFFRKLALLMKSNPPTADDAPILAKMAKIGLVPGQDFDITKQSPEITRGLKQVPKLAVDKITAHQKDAGKIENGWMVTTKTGSYGVDYLQRAYIAAIGLGANLSDDAIYPVTEVDSDGSPLNGTTTHYVLHFDKGEIPPTKGFWSLTLYNDQYFFVNNLLNRYTLSPRNQLQYNLDGSLDLYIQNASPGRDKESNWLPAPTGKFILMLRLYWPDDSVIRGTWQPPAVKKVS